MTGAAAGCQDERWCARSMRLRDRAFWSSVLMSPFLMYVVSYSFLNELLSLVKWLLLYRSLLVSLLCHWLVGRADRCGFQKVVPLVRGRFLCLWK